MLNFFILILAGLVAAGCASRARSGNDAGEPGGEAGLRAFLEQTVAHANAEAAKLEGETFFTSKEWRKSAWYRPAPAEEPGDAGELRIIIPDALEFPPAGGVERVWFARRSVAQRYSGRFELADVWPVVIEKDGTRIADVRVRLLAMRMWAVAEEEDPEPEPPAGMVKASGGFMGSGSGWRRGLPIPSIPGATTRPVGALAEQAAMELSKKEMESVEATVKLRATYRPDGNQWVLTRVSEEGIWEALPVR